MSAIFRWSLLSGGRKDRLDCNHNGRRRTVVITLFVTVLLLPFPSAALSIVKIAFYLFLLPFSILSQPL